MELTEITETVIKLAKKVDDKSETLKPDSALVADLGLESVQIIEFLCEVEDHFDIVIGEDSLADVVTVSDLAKLVHHLITEK
mgnify:CR=1 FL=1